MNIIRATYLRLKLNLHSLAQSIQARVDGKTNKTIMNAIIGVKTIHNKVMYLDVSTGNRKRAITTIPVMINSGDPRSDKYQYFISDVRMRLCINGIMTNK